MEDQENKKEELAEARKGGSSEKRHDGFLSEKRHADSGFSTENRIFFYLRTMSGNCKSIFLTPSIVN